MPPGGAERNFLDRIILSGALLRIPQCYKKHRQNQAERVFDKAKLSCHVRLSLGWTTFY